MKILKTLLMSTLLFALAVSPCYATVVSQFFTYQTTSQVTNTRLNGNLQNIITVVNGGLDNANAAVARGFRFYEVLGALPAAGTQGRMIYLTTNNTFNLDTGIAFVQVINVPAGSTQGDVIYFDGTGWARLGAGNDGQSLQSGGAAANPAFGWAFTDEGDSAAFDWTEAGAPFLGNLDNAWHDMDVSAVATVPDGATAVILFVKTQDNAAGTRVSFRENGNANAFNMSEIFSAVANVTVAADLTVPCDINGDIEFRANAGIASIDIAVKGFLK